MRATSPIGVSGVQHAGCWVITSRTCMAITPLSLLATLMHGAYRDLPAPRRAPRHGRIFDGDSPVARRAQCGAVAPDLHRDPQEVIMRKHLVTLPEVIL